ncbi:CGNR zinc finger domain-containing protein [Kribbella lupini]|uniref:CGNR zinc finger domain-containing protein n=1 Tax=Kribbella lupini TaxID=291602 RepID=A0ABP4LDR3_9ACTN
MDVIVEFLNTVDQRSFSRHGQSHVGGERLASPADLAECDILTAGDELGPEDLTDAITLRTALRQSLSGEIDASKALADYPLQLAPDHSGGLRIAAQSGRPWLDAIVETVVVAVGRGEWSRVKLCAAPDCRWAFHDTSRSGRGRWCDMNICGNRHKTRVYRERRQQAG